MPFPIKPLETHLDGSCDKCGTLHPSSCVCLVQPLTDGVQRACQYRVCTALATLLYTRFNESARVCRKHAIAIEQDYSKHMHHAPDCRCSRCDTDVTPAALDNVGPTKPGFGTGETLRPTDSLPCARCGVVTPAGKVGHLCDNPEPQAPACCPAEDNRMIGFGENSVTYRCQSCGNTWVEPVSRPKDHTLVGPHPFKYVAPTQDSVVRLSHVRTACAGLYDLIMRDVPAGKYRDQAEAALDVVSAMANKAIVMGQE